MRWLPGVLVLVLSGGVVQYVRRAPSELREESRLSVPSTRRDMESLEDGTGSPVVEKLGSAKAQLAHALGMKRLLRGSRGEERDKARRRAVEAYRAVRRYFPREHAIASEAAFRAGELLRSAGEYGLAIVEFDQARILGRKQGFGPRAALEIGHLERRRLRFNDALAAYEAVQSLGEDCAAERDIAAYWAGRVHLRLDRPKDALRCFERAARQGVEPVQRIRAFDSWAGILIDRGDLEGAAGVLELCRGSVKDFAEEETRLGIRVRGALAAMASVPKLEREIELRRKRNPLEPPPAAIRQVRRPSNGF